MSITHFDELPAFDNMSLEERTNLIRALRNSREMNPLKTVKRQAQRQARTTKSIGDLVKNLTAEQALELLKELQGQK